MTGKLEKNKSFKENALLEAAYDLFSSLGINDTTIDGIVKKAGVAKGTFYLYFKNKYDILDGLVVQKTSVLLKNALAATNEKNFENRVERVKFFISFIIDELAKDRLLMRIVHKDLSYSLYRKVLEDPKRGGELKKFVAGFKNDILGRNFQKEESDYVLFILLESTGSVCYSAIINNEPAPVAVIKPVLLKMIGKMIE